MQQAAQSQVELITGQLEKLRESAPPEKDLTHAAIDKKRADAVQQFQGWESRMRSKQDQTNHEVQIASSAIDDAMTALQQQKAALHDRYKAHQAAWLTINLAHKQAQITKIAELEARCKETAAEIICDASTLAKGATDDAATQIAHLHAIVLDLQTQLKAFVLPSAPAADATMTETSNETAIESTDAFTKALEAPIIPSLTQDEKAARIARAAALADQLSNGRGKGKGADSASSLSPGLEY